MIDILFKKLETGAYDPRNAYGESAGWDLFALEETYVPVGTGKDIRTGIAIALPPGYFARIVGRSSALRKRGLVVIEGIIDEGFRGELFSYVFNPGINQGKGVILRSGESIAQILIHKVEKVAWLMTNDLPSSIRGERGFGSSDEH